MLHRRPLVAMIVIGLIILHPRVFVAMLNLLLRKIRRQPIAAAPPIARYIWPVLASMRIFCLRSGYCFWTASRSRMLR